MKKIIISAIAILVAGCSTFKKDEPKVEQPKPVVVPATPKHTVPSMANMQKMTTAFKRKGLKLEWGCTQRNKECVDPEVVAIEVTAYATTNGTSENNRDIAFKLATLRAKAKLRKFIYEDVSTSTVTRVLSKNVEQANEKFKVDNANENEIVVSDDDSAGMPSSSSSTLRENNNRVVRYVSETIKSNAAGILRGVYTVDEAVVNNNNVSVTIRWDRNLEKISDYLKFRFSN